MGAEALTDHDWGGAWAHAPSSQARNLAGLCLDYPVTWVPTWAEAERGKFPNSISYPPPPADSMETEICPGQTG